MHPIFLQVIKIWSCIITHCASWDFYSMFLSQQPTGGQQETIEITSNTWSSYKHDTSLLIFTVTFCNMIHLYLDLLLHSVRLGMISLYQDFSMLHSLKYLDFSVSFWERKDWSMPGDSYITLNRVGFICTCKQYLISLVWAFTCIRKDW